MRQRASGSGGVEAAMKRLHSPALITARRHSSRCLPPPKSMSISIEQAALRRRLATGLGLAASGSVATWNGRKTGAGPMTRTRA